MNIELFDVKAYLNDRGVRFYTSGKNCSPGWVNIRCLFCSDKTNHLGVNLKSKIYRCWKCKRKGPVTHIIRALGETNVEEVLNEFIMIGGVPSLIKSAKVTKYLPKEASDELPIIHQAYLEYRGFDPLIIQNNYKVKACWEGGKYKFRLIIPIIMNHRIAGFTARDVSNKSALRYKQQPAQEAPVHPRNWVYNIDSVQETAVIVEGPFDVWRMGNSFTSFMGTEVTPEQIGLLVNRGVKRAITLYDPEEEAQELAEYYAQELSIFIPEVEQIELDLPEGKDPADLTPQEAAYLRSQIL